MSDKFASTTSLISTHASTGKPADSKKSDKTKPKPTKKEKAPVDNAQQAGAAWSDSKFAEMAAKNGWSAPTATRPSF